MPLPDTAGGNVDWPPRELGRVTPKLQEWSAWYAGDAQTLSRQYGAFGSTGASSAPRPRPAQFAGGLQGTVARFFWGAPLQAGQQRVKLHVPVAGDIATASSDLLFSEALGVTLPDTAAAGEERLQELLDGILWDSLLLEQGELNAALGGVYLRAVWDREVEPNHPLATVVHADAAVPEFSYGRLRAVTFWQVVGRDGQRVQRLLERHEPGRIEWGLYEGTEDKLGRRVDFGGSEATRTLEGVVDAESGVETGWGGLTAVYIPNMKPNRLWRDDPLGSQLGRSDYDEIEPLMDAVDETMTSWMRDVRLGKGRILVPNYMLQNNGVGRASTFNIDQEVFTGLAMAPEESATPSQQLTVQQFAIRTAEHSDTIRGLLSAAFRGAGYSAQTFGLLEESAPTATEVNARERRSYTTREKKSRYYTDGLAKFLRALLAVDTLQFNGGIELDVLPQVEFPPSSQPSQAELSQSVQQLRAAQVLSIDTGVKMVHPDWDEPAVAEEVARIMAEQQASMPAQLDPLGVLPGDEGGGDPAAPAGMSPAELSEASEALGRLVRAGVDPADAAARVGLTGVRFALPAVGA